MSGGTDGTERFEQIGQSWVKHTFFALEDTFAGLVCTGGARRDHLAPGCSDPYGSGLNGDQRFNWLSRLDQSFHRIFPGGVDENNQPTSNDHSRTTTTTVSRTGSWLIASDLISGVQYFGEAAYIAPHEFTWCQSHPDQCNMFNNFSYRPFSITVVPTHFTFYAQRQTSRQQPAITAWPTRR